ncbi:YraN family protein [Sphingobacterium sp. HJSM2_6]|uniref:YraN family protein n=1 Tax=Sphingobacterium sp. HJSM2_6 TaxID=3366264 RepID=UPI003BD9B053
MGKTYRKTLGDKGEEMAVLFLKKLGYEIIELNWRYKKLEVDIIALDQQDLVFVEVKVRSNASHVLISDLISEHQQENLARAAESYMMEKGYEGQIRFDFLFYINNKLHYMKDAFWNY